MSECPDIAEWEALTGRGADAAGSDALQSHLLACAKCRSVRELVRRNERLLGSLRAALGDRSTPGEPAESLIGRRVGKYHIVGLLGRGGMATVYEATQERPRRTVALKLMNQSLSTGTALRRFEHEADILGRLGHPGIAQIYEAGVADIEVGAAAGDQAAANGPLAAPRAAVLARQPYFAMELVRGERLTDFAERRSLGTRERLAIFARICQAVQYAHQKGVIHRDLKPGNILVVDLEDKHGAQGIKGSSDQGIKVAAESSSVPRSLEPSSPSAQPKILDFGVARVTDTDVFMTTARTDVGQLIGTLAYMSPEQATGDPTLLDTRSDVYTLGVILYELLAGRLPYDVRRKAVPEIVRIIREDDPTPLSAVNHVLHGDLGTIVAKALEKDPQRRYSSAAALEDDVERYLTGRPVLARPTSAAYQFQKFAARNKALVGGAAATMLALLLGLFGTAYGLLQATQQKDIALSARASAERQREEADRRRREAEAMTNLLTQMLGSANPHEVKGRGYTVLQLLDDFSRSFESQLAEQPEIEADIRATMGHTYRLLGAYDEAERHLRRALELRDARLGSRDALTLRSRLELAWLFHDQARYDAAAAEMRAVLEVRRQTLGRDHVDVASSMNGLADVLRHPGKRDEAEPLVREALRMRRGLLGSAHPDVAESLANLAKLLREKGEFAPAEDAVVEAIDIWRAAYGPEHPLIVDALNEKAWIAMMRGEIARAESICETAIEMARRLLGDDHPDLANGLYGLAMIRRARGDHEAAERLMREALAIYRRAHGAVHPSVATALDSLGLIQYSRGDLDGAERSLREALDMRQRLFGEEHGETASSMANVASLLRARGNLGEAEALNRRIIARRRRVLGERHPEVAFGLSNLAGVLRSAKRDTEAQAAYREALDIATTALGPDHIFVANCMSNLGQMAQEHGDYDEAGRLLGGALTIARRYGVDQRADLMSFAHNLARFLHTCERFDESERMLSDVIEATRGAAADRRLAIVLTDFGYCLRKLARLTEAEAALREALDISVSALGGTHEQTRAAARELAAVYQASGDRAKAAELAEYLAALRDSQSP